MPWPALSFSNSSITRRLAAATPSPSRKPELYATPSSVCATSPTLKVAASAPCGSTTGVTESPYLRAKSRSRWSCAGQPKMAPVPYSISTKFAIQTGYSCPLKGCLTLKPVSKPRFSACSIAASDVPMRRHSAMNSAAFASRAPAAAAKGCSAATARNDMPNSVSGRVVNTSTSEISTAASASLNRTFAPSLRPIQFDCISFTRSGQRSSPPSASSRSGANFVMLKNHWLSCFFSTNAPDRQPRPSITCSLASTVPSTGSQFTQDSLRSTSPARQKSTKSFC